MKNALIFTVLMAALTGFAAPIRVALMDFDDQTGKGPDPALGRVEPAALAAKGAFLLAKQLLGREGFVLIDRRDFMAQIEQLRPTDAGAPTPTRPSFIQAAQALNADAVLRGALMGFSSGKRVVNQGGYKTEFNTLSVRVGVEALDPVDGSVIATADGAASGDFRQTEASYSELSEDEIVTLMEKAVAGATPALVEALGAKAAREEARPKVKISIKTDADPALVEVDGILVGTTPVQGLAVYQGDHVLTVGKPGYQDVTKRILFEKDASIEVPMLRTDLSADEWKQVLEKARLNLFNVDPGIVITTVE